MLSALEYIGFQKVIKVAQQDITAHAGEAGFVNLMFEEGIGNVDIANVASALLRKNPLQEFTILTRATNEDIGELVANSDTHITRYLDVEGPMLDGEEECPYL